MTHRRFHAIFSGMTEDEREVIFAALAAMAIDCHAPQDNLTSGQWCVAHQMFEWLNKPSNLRGLNGEAPTYSPADRAGGGGPQATSDSR
jgi:hypothetical protein